MCSFPDGGGLVSAYVFNAPENSATTYGLESKKSGSLSSIEQAIAKTKRADFYRGLVKVFPVKIQQPCAFRDFLRGSNLLSANEMHFRNCSKVLASIFSVIGIRVKCLQ